MLQRLAEPLFDVSLLDVRMPVMDGRETIIRIRASSQSWRNLPVILLTADAMSGDRERDISMGMDDYISEAIDGCELAPRYSRLLQNQRQDAAAACPMGIRYRRKRTGPPAPASP